MGETELAILMRGYVRRMRFEARLLAQELANVLYPSVDTNDDSPQQSSGTRLFTSDLGRKGE